MVFNFSQTANALKCVVVQLMLRLLSHCSLVSI